MGSLLSKRGKAKKAKSNSNKSNDSAGNINYPANTSNDLRGPTQHLSDQLESSNDNEALITRTHQVPAVDVPLNRKQSGFIVKSKDNKTSNPKPVQQVTPAGPDMTVGEMDALKSVQTPTKMPCIDASPQVKFSFGSKEQQQIIPRLRASKIQSIRHTWDSSQTASQVPAARTPSPASAAPDADITPQVSLSQDTAVKIKLTRKPSDATPPRNKRRRWRKCYVEKKAQKSAMIFGAQSRWPPFTVRQSCSQKARCRHNPGTGLPPNVQKWAPQPSVYFANH